MRGVLFLPPFPLLHDHNINSVSMQKLQVFEPRSPYVIIPNLNGESKQKLQFFKPIVPPSHSVLNWS